MSKRQTWYEIKNLTDETTDVFLYSEIGGYGMASVDFIKALSEIKGHITCHVNSPGGSIFEGIAIYNYLIDRDITMIVDGLAASMASAIVMAGKHIIMMENASMMIHKPWTQLCGTAEDLKKAADILDAMEAKLIDIYTTGTSLPADQIKAMLEKETWLDAKEALKLGFCDEIKKGSRTKNAECIMHNAELTNEGSKTMEKILQLLGVETETQALTTIKSLQAAQAALQGENANLQKEVATRIIESDILNKRLLPSQKGIAEKLLATDPALYNEFLATAATPDLTKKVVITASKPADITYQTLLDDSELHAKMLKESPETVEALEKEWRKNVR